jgi:hypothetical protein
MKVKLDFKKLAIKLIQILKELKIPYMFTGGLAVNAYGFLRATFDFDLVVILKEKNIKKLVLKLKEFNFDLIEEDLRKILEIGNRFMTRTKDSIYRIDFWLVKTDYDKLAFSRRKQKIIFNKKVWLISAEDLILIKLFYGGRGKDIDDAIGVLKRQKDKLDYSYLTKEAKILGIYGELKKIL